MYAFHQIGDENFLMPSVLYRYEFGRGDRILNEQLLEGFEELLGGRYRKSLDDLIKKHNEFVEGILKK